MISERARHTVSTIGPAVLNGGFSTFLAFILLATSNSYVFTTFFKVCNRMVPTIDILQVYSSNDAPLISFACYVPVAFINWHHTFYYKIAMADLLWSVIIVHLSAKELNFLK